MVETVLLHAPADAAFARELAQSFAEGSVVPCAVPAEDGPPLQFGAKLLVFGLWTARSEDAAGARLQDTLDSLPRRAALLVWDNRKPPVGEGAGRTPTIAMADDAETMRTHIAEIMRSLKLGIYVSTSMTPPAPKAPPPAPPAPPPKREQTPRSAAPDVRDALSPPPTPLRVPEHVVRARRVAGNWGFALGILIGAAVVIAGLAPYASHLIARERAQNASSQARAPS